MFSGCESADLCPNIDELEKNDRTKNKRERQKAFQGNSDANPTGSWHMKKALKNHFFSASGHGFQLRTRLETKRTGVLQLKRLISQRDSCHCKEVL